MECLKEITTELIDDLKHTDHDKYKAVELKMYHKVFGDHMNEELAHKWVEKMTNKDGTTGGHWTLEQTTPYMGRHNKYDWYVAMNMVYSDYYNPKFDVQTYVQLANDWLDDHDAHDGKLLKYYMYIVK